MMSCPPDHSLEPEAVMDLSPTLDQSRDAGTVTLSQFVYSLLHVWCPVGSQTCTFTPQLNTASNTDTTPSTNVTFGCTPYKAFGKFMYLYFAHLLQVAHT